LVATGVGVASSVIGGSVISLIGFKSAGVAVGSAAACIQSTIGAVSAGSIFAGFQSLGATCLLFNPPVVVVTGAISGGTYLVYKYFVSKKEKNS